MIQIYSPILSKRLEYTLHVIFNNILKTKYVWIDDYSKIDRTKPIINYSTEDHDATFQIKPHTLLFENDIHPISIKVEDEFYFFKTSKNGSCLYDIFASTFFMITRYEEYLETDKDEHHRFPAEKSLAYKYHFLDKAVVNRWALEIQKIIQEKIPLYSIPDKKYHYISSIDIDSAFAFRAKGMVRLLGGLLKAFLRKDKDDIQQRISYIFKKKLDPFDTFNIIHSNLEAHNIESVFFFLVSRLSPFDKNINPKKKAFQNIIRTVSSFTSVGLHPSYRSNKAYSILQEEKLQLEQITGQRIQKSRQHFLKLEWPNTYHKLVKLGIKEDYTMGFASQVGFRAGICTPYPFFDLTENRELPITIFPFQIMDGTLNQYLKLSPKEAIAVIQQITDEVKFVKGTFISLWHNESLSEMRHWKNWKNVFSEMLSIAK